LQDEKAALQRFGPMYASVPVDEVSNRKVNHKQASEPVDKFRIGGAAWEVIGPELLQYGNGHFTLLNLGIVLKKKFLFQRIE
jgi:hypothetical protein